MTGLDPASRRQVWEVIENIKEGRSVVSMWGWVGGALFSMTKIMCRVEVPVYITWCLHMVCIVW